MNNGTELCGEEGVVALAWSTEYWKGHKIKRALQPVLEGQAQCHGPQKELGVPGKGRTGNRVASSPQQHGGPGRWEESLLSSSL